ncbi:MAG: ribosome rescue protein RqcH [Promethearchaeota archaeon]
MIRPVKGFSNFDVYAIVKELELVLSDGTISNVYEIENLLVLKINTQQGRKNLIIEEDSRINLTEYKYPVPKYPSQYTVSLRKFLKNRRIIKIYQHNFDRIIIIELSNFDTEPWKFVIEFFNKGNFLLLDENNIIKIAKKYKRYRDRNILANKEYIFPKSRGKDFLTINREEFKVLMKANKNVELVRYLARNVNIAGFYSEEVCHRAGIDKTLFGMDLTEDDLEKLYKSFKKLRNDFLFGTIDAQIVFDDNDNEISVIPFELKIFKDNKRKRFESFNKASDYFYSKLDEKKLIIPENQKIVEQIEALEKILKNQQDYLGELKNKKQKYYKYGDFIYSNFNMLEKLVEIIQNARKKGYDWEEINSKLQKAKMEDMEGIEIFEKLIPTTKQLIIKINGSEVFLDLNKSIGENANLIYSKGKKADKKIKGTITAIEKTKEKIGNLELEKESMEEGIDFFIKKPKLKWYEKFRWFFSSNGFLVIGGRDASSNEVIFKKYIDTNDLIFHTNFPGSPLTVIKNPKDEKIPEMTLNETANFVVSYSRAWKENWTIADAFYIKSTQISKSPPSGEFLPKGSFIISGKKNFIKNAKTELAIGLNFIEISPKPEEKDEIFYPKLICGPLSAIQNYTDNFIIIIPSKSSGLKKGKLAQEIKTYFFNHSDNNLKKWVKLLTIDEILLYLPNGLSSIKSDSS